MEMESQCQIYHQLNYAGNHFFPLEFPDQDVIIILIIPAERQVTEGVEEIRDEETENKK